MNVDEIRELIKEYDALECKINRVIEIQEFNNSIATKLIANDTGKFVDLYDIDHELGRDMQNVINLQLEQHIDRFTKRRKQIQEILGGIK